MAASVCHAVCRRRLGMRAFTLGTVGLAVALLLAMASGGAAEEIAAEKQDPSLLQARTKVYSAAAARASLHAGVHASASRFQHLANRVGIDVSDDIAGPHHQRQSHKAQSQQAIMLDIVEKVLQEQGHHAAHSARDGTKAEAVESEFHLLNALMEKQSEMREFARDSDEKEHIGGMSRKFLKDVTDRAIKNALAKVRHEHPHMSMHTSEPVHLYGVRSPYNGHKHAAPKPKGGALYSEEALADPYLSRNAYLDPVERATAFAERTSPQVVYRLGAHDNALLAEHEVAETQKFVHHRRSPQHEARRNSRTPRPPRQAKAAAPGAVPAQPSHTAAHQAAPVAGVAAPIQTPGQPQLHPKTVAQEAPAHAQHDAKTPAASFLEIDSHWDALHAAYREELEAHAEVHGSERPWFVHHNEHDVADSVTANLPLEDLWAAYRPRETALLEMESEVGSEAEQLPLRELGILMGLNPDKKPATAGQQKPQPAASAPQAPASTQGKTAPTQPVKQPAAQPRFTQTAAKGKAKARAREDGGDDDLEAMVGAGEAYKPSSLKHPPPPPVPPPPPPPPPPKFSAE